MKNELPAQTLSDVAQAWKAGTLAKSSSSRKSSTPLWGKNLGVAVGKNSPVGITGFAYAYSYADAFKKLIADQLCLAVRPAQNGDTIAVTLEPIQQGKYGAIKTDVLFGVVNFSDATHTYATAAFTSAENGAFKIVARSASSGNYAVCALVKAGGEGGGGGGDTPTFTFSIVNATTLKIEIS